MVQTLLSRHLLTFLLLDRRIHFGLSVLMIFYCLRIMDSMRSGLESCGLVSSRTIKDSMRLILRKWSRLSIWLERLGYTHWLSFIKTCFPKLFAETVCQFGWSWNLNFGKLSHSLLVRKLLRPTFHVLFHGVNIISHMMLEKDSITYTIQNHS